MALTCLVAWRVANADVAAPPKPPFRNALSEALALAAVWYDRSLQLYKLQFNTSAPKSCFQNSKAHSYMSVKVCGHVLVLNCI